MAARARIRHRRNENLKLRPISLNEDVTMDSLLGSHECNIELASMKLANKADETIHDSVERSTKQAWMSFCL